MIYWRPHSSNSPLFHQFLPFLFLHCVFIQVYSINSISNIYILYNIPNKHAHMLQNNISSTHHIRQQLWIQMPTLSSTAVAPGSDGTITALRSRHVPFSFACISCSPKLPTATPQMRVCATSCAPQQSIQSVPKRNRPWMYALQPRMYYTRLRIRMNGNRSSRISNSATGSPSGSGRSNIDSGSISNSNNSEQHQHQPQPHKTHHNTTQYS